MTLNGFDQVVCQKKKKVKLIWSSKGQKNKNSPTIVKGIIQ